MAFEPLKYRSSLMQSQNVQTFEQRSRRDMSIDPRAIALQQPPPMFTNYGTPFVPPNSYVDPMYVDAGYVEYTY